MVHAGLLLKVSEATWYSSLAPFSNAKAAKLRLNFKIQLSGLG